MIGLRPRLGVLRQYRPRKLVPAPSGSAGDGRVMPSVSLVMPSLNQARFLGPAIDSVVSQNYPALEFFVQDGGSNDGSVSLLERRAGELSGWCSEQDDGQTDAINRAFARTRGGVMGWLNADDMLLPGALRSIAQAFLDHPDADVVYGNRLMIDEDGLEIGRWVLPGHDASVLSWTDYIPQETVFWRRGIWERVGGSLDPSFRFAMDWDLLLRFREAGAVFLHLPRFLGAFRVHEAQKTSSELSSTGRAEMDLLRRRALGRVPARAERLLATAPFLVRHLIADWKVAAVRNNACHD
jgi:glycosyltransferase involved in cell wall biosynthesis